MKLTNEIKSMSHKQKRDLKRRLKSFLSHILVQAVLAISVMYALGVIYQLTMGAA